MPMYVLPNKRRAVRRRAPVRRYKRRVYRPRTSRKSVANRVVTTRITRQPAVSDRLFTKLNYHDFKVGPSILGSTLTNVLTFQTSLFDPDYAVGGHQPMWYDQYCPMMYSNYRVYGIKWHITATNRGINESWILACRNQNSPVADTVLTTMQERGDCKWRLGSSVNSGNNTIRLSGYLSLAKVRGCNKSDVATEAIYEAAYNANPAAMGYLLVYLYHTASGAVTVFDIAVRLTYYCELSGRVSPSGS